MAKGGIWQEKKKWKTDALGNGPLVTIPHSPHPPLGADWNCMHSTLRFATFCAHWLAVGLHRATTATPAALPELAECVRGVALRDSRVQVRGHDGLFRGCKWERMACDGRSRMSGRERCLHLEITRGHLPALVVAREAPLSPHCMENQPPTKQSLEKCTSHCIGEDFRLLLFFQYYDGSRSEINFSKEIRFK